MTTQKLHRALTATFLLFSIQCGSTPTDLFATGTVVYGVVSANGIPVPGATVEIGLFYTNCQFAGALTTQTTKSMASGAYRTFIVVGNLVGSQCVRLTASTDQGSVSKDAVVNIHAAPFDSVRVDLAMP